MEQLKKFYEREGDGAIYSFRDGYIVLIYGDDSIYFTTELLAAKEAIGWYREE